MKISTKKILSVAAFAFCGLLAADVKPALVFQNHMVLQRDKEVPVWGTADPGENVTVEFAGQKLSNTADAQGKWMVKLAPLKTSATGAKMTISGKNKLELDDLLVGEVWLASGQSNMGFVLPDSINGDAEVASAKYPEIRFLPVKCVWSKEPTDQFTGKWQKTTPENAKGFSAIAYFYARELHKTLNVPVGIIQSAWGGTPAQSWMPIEDVKARPELYGHYLDNYNKFLSITGKELAELRAEAEKSQRRKDPGNEGEKKGWHETNCDTSTWKTLNVPGYLEQVFPGWDGVFWFRREVEIPSDWAGKELTFVLGAVDDVDMTYFNGKQVGSTGTTVPEWWDYQRIYKIPASLVKAGKNTIAVRVVDERFAGGLAGPKIYLEGPDGKQINLAGTWSIMDEVKMKPLPMPQFAYIPHIPSYLWNGMINPFVPFAIRGVIWHQGENNSGEPEIYRSLFQDLITSWRREFKQGDFPFYYIQLSNYMKRLPTPTQTAGGWPGLREAQTMALRLPNTGMAVTIDIGDANDIHPRNKQENGRRLALIALVNTYGMKDAVWHGPMFQTAEFKDGKAILSFDTGSFLPNGLVKKGDSLTGFTICGEDHMFVPAEANIISTHQVEVSNPQVAKPIAVRYAWANNPECNLFNPEGLPACPFRTDSFVDKKK